MSATPLRFNLVFGTKRLTPEIAGYYMRKMIVPMAEKPTAKREGTRNRNADADVNSVGFSDRCCPLQTFDWHIGRSNLFALPQGHAPSPSFSGLRVFPVVRRIDLGLAAKTHSSGLFGNPQKKSEDGRGSWRRSKRWAAHGLEGANEKRSGGPPCLELLECLADSPALLDPLSVCPGPKDPALLDPTRLGVPSSLISKLRSPM
ncbi:hypothetical protein BDK51DRAFT_50649 [Blyttiomyces helicus]|uniref:Uncharacterized protein n=1 Tax=Blyttiomyces helicus TaxID=388810 RepID=A0A4P9VTA3_9FUNG|nr:hypothetical protein BDK51DRAFT_50649 [Blyttiomyces helicus]|eukprot:RKO82741.1 hypothetical protein BDK51DRAFT_50649 [Blyttiomyces helicus]